MDLLILNGYTTPNPATYDVELSDVNGEKSQVEDGSTYIEQVRADVPTIKVSWTNLEESVAQAITDKVSDATVNVTYFYGSAKTCEMTVSARSLKLKHIDTAGNRYWDVSFTLEG